MRKGPTSHLPLHDDNDDRQTDTIEIPPTEILDRIFIRMEDPATKSKLARASHASHVSHRNMLSSPVADAAPRARALHAAHFRVETTAHRH